MGGLGGAGLVGGVGGAGLAGGRSGIRGKRLREVCVSRKMWL